MGRLYQLIGAFCVALVFYYVWTACRGLKYRKSLLAVQAANLIFVLIGYKHLSMPVLTMFVMGAVGIPLIIYSVMYDTNVSLLIATVYLPYNLLLPGTFGGILKALNVTNIILIALVIALFIGKNKAAASAQRRNPAVILVILFMAISIFSFIQGGLLFRSGYYGSIIFPLKRWLTPFFVFYLFYKKVPDRMLIKIIFAIALITIIANIYFGLLQWVNLGFGMYAERKYRLGGFNLHPNYFGAFIAYYISFLVGPFLFEYKKTAGKFLLFPILLGLRVIIPVNSRGAWIAIPPAFLTMGIFRSKILIPLVILAVLLVLALPDVLIPQAIQERFASVTQTIPAESIYALEGRAPGEFLGESREISFRVRYLLLQGGLRMSRDSPWFGFGWWTFNQLVGKYTEGGVVGTPHNIWLKILCEMGLVGLTVLLGIFLVVFKTGIYVLRREQDPMLKGMVLGLMGSIPALMVNNMTGSRLDSVDLNIIFWIIAACVIRLKEIIRSEKAVSAQGVI